MPRTDCYGEQTAVFRASKQWHRLGQEISQLIMRKTVIVATNAQHLNLLGALALSSRLALDSCINVHVRMVPSNSITMHAHVLDVKLATAPASNNTTTSTLD
jgi:hypothetical protein